MQDIELLQDGTWMAKVNLRDRKFRNERFRREAGEIKKIQQWNIIILASQFWFSAPRVSRLELIYHSLTTMPIATVSLSNWSQLGLNALGLFHYTMTKNVSLIGQWRLQQWLLTIRSLSEVQSTHSRPWPRHRHCTAKGAVWSERVGNWPKV